MSFGWSAIARQVYTGEGGRTLQRVYSLLKASIPELPARQSRPGHRSNPWDGKQREAAALLLPWDNHGPTPPSACHHTMPSVPHAIQPVSTGLKGADEILFFSCQGWSCPGLVTEGQLSSVPRCTGTQLPKVPSYSQCFRPDPAKLPQFLSPSVPPEVSDPQLSISLW